MPSAGERQLSVNGVDLAIDGFGASSDPAIVLVGGAASSMDWWDDALCDLLAAPGRHVVRYDLRDTGRSTTRPLGEADYTGRDLVDDLARLIETLEIAPAHVVGLSLGGGLAQQLALLRPELVATLTLISTSPGGPGSPDAAVLPGPSPALAESFASDAPAVDWADRVAVEEYYLQAERLFSGTIPVDEDRIRSIAARIFDRSHDPSAGDNHWSLDEGDMSSETIESITAPTLIIHGTADPLFPIEHGEALAERIPDALLLPIEGMGHQFPPPPTWDAIVPAIIRHTATAE